jgi:hypothetical protein
LGAAGKAALMLVREFSSGQTWPIRKVKLVVGNIAIKLDGGDF